MFPIKRPKKGMMLVLTIFCILFTATISLNSCRRDDLSAINKATILFNQKLSDYHIFKGNPKNLVPANDFHIYSLATQLFTDYAEKQRLIRIPANTKLVRIDDELPDFPDSTIIVKTFYYYHDKRDTSKGKRIIETRLLVKSNSFWNVATYFWNDEQSEAYLLESGANTAVNWISETGDKRVIAYHIPNKRECATCHNSNNEMLPIGPKIRNLNFDVVRNGQNVNQLKNFQSIGILNDFDTRQASSLPQAFNANVSIQEQARAYLDINCAHCHNPKGDAKETNLFLQYKLALGETGITKNKDGIKEKMEKGSMPLLGTTIIHKEGLELIKRYIDGL